MLDHESALLVVVDVQGKLAELMWEKDELFANLRKIIQGCRIMEIPVLWAEQYPKGLGPTVPAVAEVLAGLEPISKMTFSCCGSEEFNARVNELGREQIILVGIETHVCVHQTCEDLLALNYDVHLPIDGVSSRTKANRELGIERMRDEGAVISGVEMALFELLQTAENEKFKEVVKLVK